MRGWPARCRPEEIEVSSPHASVSTLIIILVAVARWRIRASIAALAGAAIMPIAALAGVAIVPITELG